MFVELQASDAVLAPDVDAEFLALVCSDTDLLDAEFAAIVEALEPPRCTPPVVPRSWPGDGRAGADAATPHRARHAGARLVRRQWTGRERSPPRRGVHGRGCD
ncbi:hypothetical protein [Terrabacter sp. NPDC080008]|uniref:hypothetical protein n=1 Tax=Terrabacter sp. NPDC080008 TaxID=3155176 RepID=UPI00344C6D7B